MISSSPPAWFWRSDPDTILTFDLCHKHLPHHPLAPLDLVLDLALVWFWIRIWIQAWCGCDPPRILTRFLLGFFWAEALD